MGVDDAVDGSTSGDAMGSDHQSAGGDEATVRQDVDARARIAAFVRRYGHDVVAVVNHVGRIGSRIVLIAPNGEFGDVLTSGDEAARALCDEAGVAVREWDRETAGLINPTPADRITMGTRTH